MAQQAAEHTRNITPIRRQYLEIKRRHPHAIVFFRLGDFYETFDEDAQLCARELEITLTSRPMGKTTRIPMAGVPHHALETYLARLIAKGYKVAICEQTGTGSRGLMERQVVRVVTPGTVLEDKMLQERANNYLAALVEADGRVGLAYVDITTGEFAATQTDGESALTELVRLRPSELLATDDAPPGVEIPLTRVDREWLDEANAAALIKEHFDAVSLSAFGLEGWPLATVAAAVVLRYLKQTQPAALAYVTRLQTYQVGSYMLIDAYTRRNLEIDGASRRNSDGGLSLLSILDLTKTAMGGRLLRRWLGQPLLDVDMIKQRQDAVALLLTSGVLRGRVGETLARVPDLERLLGRTSAGVAQPRELVALGRGLALVPALREALQAVSPADAGQESARQRLLLALRSCEEAVGLIARSISDDPPASFEEGGVVRPGFAPELDELQSLARDARRYLADLEQRERNRTGIRSLRLGYNRVFGYYIEISRASLASVPDEYERRQTLANAERFVTPELKEYELRILHARERIAEMEQAIFRQVCAQVAAQGRQILAVASAVAELDCYYALAECAARYGYVRPEVYDGPSIIIREGRHPVVERALGEGRFVPNDASLDPEDAQILIMTGPNMAGKSTYLRQVALTVLMAQIGSYVPAASARIGVVDRIFTRIGAHDDLAGGHSTFMVEMLETAYILHNVTPRSLVVLDEIGRGTSTYDGMAIARAVVEFLHSRPQAAAKTLFATHYHELTSLAAAFPRVKNYHVAVAEEDGKVVFLYRILPGGADRSYGIHVAELAGLPRAVVTRAREILAELESYDASGSLARATNRRHARRSTTTAIQIPLFGARPPLIDELAELDVDALTPLEAITKLYELRKKAREV